jgi:hypothetical protein
MASAADETTVVQADDHIRNPKHVTLGQATNLMEASRVGGFTKDASLFRFEAGHVRTLRDRVAMARAPAPRTRLPPIAARGRAALPLLTIGW